MEQKDDKSDEEEHESVSKQIIDYYKRYSQNRELPKYFSGSSLSYMPQIATDDDTFHSVDETLKPGQLDDEPKPLSPASSTISAKKLEWDNGADIGYSNCSKLHKSLSLPTVLTSNSGEKFDSSRISAFLSSSDDSAQQKTLSSSTSSPLFSNIEPTASVSSTSGVTKSSSSSQVTLAFIKTQIGAPGAESTPKEDLEAAQTQSLVASTRIDYDETPLIPKRADRKNRNFLELCQTKAVVVECLNTKTATDKHIQTSLTNSSTPSSEPPIVPSPNLNQNLIIIQEATPSSASAQSGSELASFEYYTELGGGDFAPKSSSSSPSSSLPLLAQIIQQNQSQPANDAIDKSLTILQKLIKSKKYDPITKKRYIHKIIQKIVDSKYSDESTTSSEQFPAKSTEPDVPNAKLSGGGDQLVNFAKSERQHQLDWISNEIGHLTKLKGLLEQNQLGANHKTTTVYMISTPKCQKAGKCTCCPCPTSKPRNYVIETDLPPTSTSSESVEYRFRDKNTSKVYKLEELYKTRKPCTTNSRMHGDIQVETNRNTTSIKIKAQRCSGFRPKPLSLDGTKFDTFPKSQRDLVANVCHCDELKSAPPSGGSSIIDFLNDGPKSKKYLFDVPLNSIKSADSCRETMEKEVETSKSNVRGASMQCQVDKRDEQVGLSVVTCPEGVQCKIPCDCKSRIVCQDEKVATEINVAHKTSQIERDNRVRGQKRQGLDGKSSSHLCTVNFQRKLNAQVGASAKEFDAGLKEKQRELNQIKARLRKEVEDTLQTKTSQDKSCGESCECDERLKVKVREMLAKGAEFDQIREELNRGSDESVLQRDKWVDETNKRIQGSPKRYRHKKDDPRMYRRGVNEEGSSESELERNGRRRRATVEHRTGFEQSIIDEGGRRPNEGVRRTITREQWEKVSLPNSESCSRELWEDDYRRKLDDGAGQELRNFTDFNRKYGAHISADYDQYSLESVRAQKGGLGSKPLAKQLKRSNYGNEEDMGQISFEEYNRVVTTRRIEPTDLRHSDDELSKSEEQASSTIGYQCGKRRGSIEDKTPKVVNEYTLEEYNTVRSKNSEPDSSKKCDNCSIEQFSYEGFSNSVKPKQSGSRQKEMTLDDFNREYGTRTSKNQTLEEAFDNGTKASNKRVSLEKQRTREQGSGSEEAFDSKSKQIGSKSSKNLNGMTLDDFNKQYGTKNINSLTQTSEEGFETESGRGVEKRRASENLVEDLKKRLSRHQTVSRGTNAGSDDDSRRTYFATKTQVPILKNAEQQTLNTDEIGDSQQLKSSLDYETFSTTSIPSRRRPSQESDNIISQRTAAHLEKQTQRTRSSDQIRQELRDSKSKQRANDDLDDIIEESHSKISFQEYSTMPIDQASNFQRRQLAKNQLESLEALKGRLSRLGNGELGLDSRNLSPELESRGNQTELRASKDNQTYFETIPAPEHQSTGVGTLLPQSKKVGAQAQPETRNKACGVCCACEVGTSMQTTTGTAPNGRKLCSCTLPVEEFGSVRSDQNQFVGSKNESNQTDPPPRNVQNQTESKLDSSRNKAVQVSSSDLGTSTSEESSSDSFTSCVCCKRGKLPVAALRSLKDKFNEQVVPLCHPCYRQRAPAANYSNPNHVCGCYSLIKKQTLNEIRETITELYCDCVEKGDCGCYGRGRRRNGMAYQITFEEGEAVSFDEEEHGKRRRRRLEEVKIKVPVYKKKQHKEKENKRKKRKLREVERRDSDFSDGNGNFSTLQEFLAKNRPQFMEIAERRRKVIQESRSTREVDTDAKKLQFLRAYTEIDNPKSTKRLFSEKEMKAITKRNYKNLPEVQQKKIDNREKQLRQANRLIADTFNKKLQDNVLKGKLTISADVNVVNL